MTALATSRCRRPDRGFSLIEMMVALAILAVALFSVMGLIIHTSTFKQFQRELTLAKQAAASKHEEISAVAGSSFAQVTTDYGPTGPNRTFNISALSNTKNVPTKRGLGTITIDATNSRLLDITVLVQWQGVRGQSSFRQKSLYTP